MSDVAIRVENLGKMYRIGGRQERYKRFTETVMDTLTAPIHRLRNLGKPAPPEETLWALKDVSLEIKHGEAVGIIGRNGAGKSTLLKILSRITEPTTGRVELHGRVGSLLEVGTGFHPELTGRENIYLNGAILGMKRAEIDRKFDEIVEFSGVEQFLDTPVKRYSSGMHVRLAFAVAAHLEPEILLIDEVLAVGDAEFQKKCLGKMGEVASEGRTVLFVSHNMGAVVRLCGRSLLIDQGTLLVDEETPAVVQAYLSGAGSQAEKIFASDPSRDVEITAMRLLSSDMVTPIKTCLHTEPFRVSIEYRIRKWPTGAYTCLDVFNETDTRLMWSSDRQSVGELTRDRPPGLYEAQVTVPGMVLAPGRYDFTAAIYSPGRQYAHEVRDRAVSIEIIDGGTFLSSLGIKPHSATIIPLAWDTRRIY